MKKGPLLITLFVIVVIIGFAYFRLVLSTASVRSVYDAVPVSSAVLFELDDFVRTYKRLQKAEYGHDLLRASFIGRMMQQLEELNQHFSNKHFQPASQHKLLASLHLSDINHYAYLFLIDVSRALDRNQFKALMLRAAERLRMRERKCKEVSVYDFYNIKGKALYSVCYFSGILIISDEASLVEEAIIQLKQHSSIDTDASFRRMRELAGGNSDMLIYLHFRNLIRLEPLLVDAAKTELIKHLSQFSGWLECDLVFEEKAIIGSGYTLPGDTVPGELARYAQKPASRLTLPAYLPESTALLLLVSCHDPHEYFSTLEKSFVDSSVIRWAPYFASWMANEWSFALLEPLTDKWQEEVFLVVKSRDSSLARQQLAELSALAGTDTTRSQSTHEDRLLIGTLIRDLFGNPLLPVENPYYQIHGDYVLFANHASTLMRVQSLIQRQHTLSHNIEYLNFSKNLSSTSNVYCYVNNTLLSGWFRAMLSVLLWAQMQQDTAVYQRFSPAAVQFNYEDHLFFTNIYIAYRNTAPDKSRIVWQLRIDTVAATPICFVLNHLTRESELVLQDAKNQLYLISKSGQIIWKKSLGGRIISKIYQVDFYNNGRLQLLFHTAHELIILDREGNYLPNFPLRLPGIATAEMLLAFYKDVNVYRIFIPCLSGIYGYEISGRPLQGWNPRANIGKVVHPLQHHVVEGKDYLIALNEKGQIFLFDRKGSLRGEPIQLKEPLSGPLHAYTTDKELVLTGISSAGTIYRISHSGEVSEISLKESGTLVDFRYMNVADDARPEYVFVYPDRLAAYDDSLQVVLEINMPALIDRPTFIPDSRFKSPYVLALPSATAQRIFLLQSDGTVFNRSEIIGFTPFEIDAYGKESSHTIVTCDHQGLLRCYQLN